PAGAFITTTRWPGLMSSFLASALVVMRFPPPVSLLREPARKLPAACGGRRRQHGAARRLLWPEPGGASRPAGRQPAVLRSAPPCPSTAARPPSRPRPVQPLPRDRLNARRPRSPPPRRRSPAGPENVHSTAPAHK